MTHQKDTLTIDPERLAIPMNPRNGSGNIACCFGIHHLRCQSITDIDADNAVAGEAIKNLPEVAKN